MTSHKATLRALREAIKAARLADAPVMLAMETLASMPEARGFQLTRSALYQMLYQSQPDQYAADLFRRADYRAEVSLGDLACFAQYDGLLREVVAAVILYLDESCSPPGTPPEHPTG